MNHKLSLTFFALIGAFGLSAQSTTPTTVAASSPPQAVAAAVANPAKPVQKATVPAKAKPAPEPSLTESARDAVAISGKWGQGTLNGRVPVSYDSKGRVIFPYGDAMPTVVCAPLRVCAIELEPGEKLTGNPNLGDKVRWELTLSYYGNPNDGSQVATFILKPQFAKLDTDLIITTDRRSYYLRLVSSDTDYIARLTFTYPEDKAKLMQEEIAQHAAPPQPIAPVVFAQQPETREDKDAAMAKALSALHYGEFRITGGKKSLCIRPTSTYEDTVSGTTYVQMPLCIAARPLPTLLVEDNGNITQSNGRYLDDLHMFVVDRLFDHAVLRAGGDRKSIRNEVHISRKKETPKNGD